MQLARDNIVDALGLETESELQNLFGTLANIAYQDKSLALQSDITNTKIDHYDDKYSKYGFSSDDYINRDAYKYESGDWKKALKNLLIFRNKDSEPVEEPVDDSVSFMDAMNNSKASFDDAMANSVDVTKQSILGNLKTRELKNLVAGTGLATSAIWTGATAPLLLAPIV